MQSSTVSTKCKIVLLGDQSVGKTSIINRFIFDNFTGNEQPTVGVDFVSKTINIENKPLRMQLWDTAGQQRFHSLIPSYIKDCTAAIIVFDLTNVSSFQNLGRWIDNVKEVRGEEALIMVMGNCYGNEGNKADLKTDVEQNLNQVANEKMKQMGLFYMEVSAKTGLNIKEFFREFGYTLCGGKEKNQSSNDEKFNTPVKKVSGVPQNTNARSVNLNLSDFNEEKKSKGKKGCC